jgi:hypothetical protein
MRTPRIGRTIFKDEDARGVDADHGVKAIQALKGID